MSPGPTRGKKRHQATAVARSSLWAYPRITGSQLAAAVGGFDRVFGLDGVEIMIVDDEDQPLEEVVVDGTGTRMTYQTVSCNSWNRCGDEGGLSAPVRLISTVSSCPMTPR